MAKSVAFSSFSFNQYTEWQTIDITVVKKINDLIKDIGRESYKGLGKPEALKHNLKGYWSRRITIEHRLVYRVIDQRIEILSCKGHYESK